MQGHTSNTALVSRSTALAVVPSAVPVAIRRIRKDLDKAAATWPAHITLIGASQTFQRVDADLALLLAPLSQCYAPFDILLDRLSVFPHSQGCSVVLEPSAFRTLTMIQKDAMSLLNLKAQKHDFHPHMTLASLKSGAGDDQTLELVSKIRNDLLANGSFPLKFTCSSLSIMVKPIGDDAYSCANSLDLVGTAVIPESNASVSCKPSFAFNRATFAWIPLSSQSAPWPTTGLSSETFSIVSYNVLYAPNSVDNSNSQSRYPRLCSVLESTDPDFIALQEVSKEFLDLLCSLPWVQERYHLSIAHAEKSKDIPTGLVFMSKMPFFSSVEVLSEGKRALVISREPFDLLDNPLDENSVVFAVVHLTSDYSSDKSALRLKQWKALNQRLPQQRQQPILVVGDFNSNQEPLLESEFQISGFADAWVVANPSSRGLTFDPSTNSLAAETSTRSARYDRILIRCSGLEPRICSLLGTDPDGDDLSDHYGLFCRIASCNDEAVETRIGSLVTDDLDLPTYESIQDDLRNDAAANEFLSMEGSIPSAASVAIRHEALQILKVFLGSLFSQSSIKLVPVGSFALNTFGPESDVDVLCVGPVSAPDFFASLRSASAWPNQCRLLRIVDDAKVPIAVVSVLSVQVDMQYVARIPGIGMQMNVHARMSLAAHRDTLMIRERVAACGPRAASTFRLAARVLKLWASRRLVTGPAAFGFPCSFALTVLLARVADQSTSASALVKRFFAEYAARNWLAQGGAVWWDSADKPISAKDHVVDDKTPMVVMSPSSTSDGVAVNVCRNAVRSSRDAWLREVARAHALDGDFHAICAAPDLLRAFAFFINIEISGTSPLKLARLKKLVELRFISLVVDAQRRCPSVSLRPIPEWFFAAENDPETSANLLVGLEKKEDLLLSVDDKRQALATLDNVLLQFETDISRREDYVAGMWLHAARVPQKAVDGFLASPTSAVVEEPLAPPSAQSRDDGDCQPRRQFSLPPAPAGGAAQLRAKSKLRSSEDVFNRILWDTAFEQDYFVVGYMDRFTGMQEVPFAEFAASRADQQGDEWIPFHRVWYFKQVKDAQELVVWDRKNKIDLVFG
ncbi:hypothetical protein HDU84_005286 [Entophlyctis sp. JEL0112]|nr:hypothetical protein HDU84_005286 [Entophlyctis sp. JEL0112]